ncbi:MAG: cupredoxin domain-containing protein [Candidatus Limnocylindria bacterium]
MTGARSRRHGAGGALAIIGSLALALGLAGIALAWSQGVAAGVARTVEIDMRWSAFSPTEVSVPAGVPVTFVLRNRDPIDHEWLVGDAAFHARHRTGTDGHHGSRPDEVSVPSGATVATTVTFRSPGEYRFICHLPGHEAYGMVGIVRVTAPAGG